MKPAPLTLTESAPMKTPPPEDLETAADWLAECCKGEDRPRLRVVSEWIREAAHTEREAQRFAAAVKEGHQRAVIRERARNAAPLSWSRPGV